MLLKFHYSPVHPQGDQCLLCRFEQMPVQATATVSSGAISIYNVDVTPLATFTSSSSMLAVSQLGVVSVAQAPTDFYSDTASTGQISVAELVTGTAMQVSPFSVEVLSSEVPALPLFCVFQDQLASQWSLT